MVGQEDQEGSGRPGEVGRVCWRDGKGQEVFWEGQEGSRVHSGGPRESGGLPSGTRVVGRLSRRAGWDLGGPHGGPGVVGRPFQRAERVGKGRETLPEIQEELGGVGRPFR